jgi:histidinol-phosphate aminotransferase
MAVYHPPLAARDGLRLDFNENTAGCSPRVLDCLRRIDAEQLAKYPAREAVETKVAEFLGVDPGELLLTNGVDEAIHLLCQTYVEADDEVLIVVPTYAMYQIYAMAAGARIVSVPMAADFQVDIEAVKARITGRTKLIAIANPNNPTGTVISNDDLIEIARLAPSAAVLVDEAYFEFYGCTMLSVRRRPPNLFVTRTFSKAYGLAGLRIGVLIGDADQMSAVRRVASPYSVNAVALACLPAAIEDRDYIDRYVAEVLESRARLVSFLDRSGIQSWPSHANFILMRVSSSASGAAEFAEQMRRRGILVRDRSRDYGCEGCIRVTLGLREQTDRLLAALQQTFEELGMAQGVLRS